MARGTTWFRYALTLALLAAGGGETWATRLDKTACADLNSELSGLLAPGLKEDMDKGPAWAAANLPPERLIVINRVIELQGQIEFRCGTPRNLAKSPTPKPVDKTPADTPGTAKAATAKSNADDSGDDTAPAKPAPKKTMRRKRGSAATSPELPVVVPVATTPTIQPRATAPAAPPADRDAGKGASGCPRDHHSGSAAAADDHRSDATRGRDAGEAGSRGQQDGGFGATEGCAREQPGSDREHNSRQRPG